MSSRIDKNIKGLNKPRGISYSKWGYIFLIPFFVTYFIFSFYPLLSTFYYSFFKYYDDASSFGKTVGPIFTGVENYKNLFSNGLKSDIFKYFYNTFIIWIVGFIPQIVISLLLAKWFTDLRLKLKATSFFKTVIYLPNIIMAASMAMMFFLLFDDKGPINAVLINNFGFEDKIRFFTYTWGARGIIAFINFIMWYGNTTIILMAAIMGVDLSLYESAQIDGASSSKIFFKITIPLIKPILIFTLITSLIGGIQMFDIPNTISNGAGTPNNTTMTVVMYLNKALGASKNYGLAGTISVVLFIVSAILSYLVFRMNTEPKKKGAK